MDRGTVFPRSSIEIDDPIQAGQDALLLESVHGVPIAQLSFNGFIQIKENTSPLKKLVECSLRDTTMAEGTERQRSPIEYDMIWPHLRQTICFVSGI